MGIFNKIGKGFKKIGNGTKGFFTKDLVHYGQKLGNMKPSDLGKIPVVGGILETAGNAGTSLGEGIREKNIGKIFKGVKGSAEALARGAVLPETFLAEGVNQARKK